MFHEWWTGMGLVGTAPTGRRSIQIFASRDWRKPQKHCQDRWWRNRDSKRHLRHTHVPRVSGEKLENCYTMKPIPVAARNKAWVCGHSLAGIVGSNPTGCMDVFLLWMLCCQVGVLASDLSLVQRSSTECGVSWVWWWRLDNEEAMAH